AGRPRRQHPARDPPGTAAHTRRLRRRPAPRHPRPGRGHRPRRATHRPGRRTDLPGRNAAGDLRAAALALRRRPRRREPVPRLGRGRRGPHRRRRPAGGARRRLRSGLRRCPSPRRVALPRASRGHAPQRLAGDGRGPRPRGRAGPRPRRRRAADRRRGDAGRRGRSPARRRRAGLGIGEGDGRRRLPGVMIPDPDPGIVDGLMPTEGPGLSLTEWVVLALLAEGPSHGFAVARTLSRATALGQVWTVPRPLVYRAIGRLEQHGLIAEAGEEPGDPGPRRMVYEVTGKGRKAAAQWRAEPVRHLREVRTALLAKVILRQRAGERLTPLIAEQRSVF